MTTTGNSAFGSTNKAWNSGSIWSQSNLSRRPLTGVTKILNPESHRSTDQFTTTKPSANEAQKGSSALFNTSVSDDWKNGERWDSKRNLTGTNSTAQAMYPNGSTEQRCGSNGTTRLSQVTSSSHESVSAFGQRLTPTTLGASFGSPFGSSYNTYLPSEYTSAGCDRPINVYTKFDRHVDSISNAIPDSAKGGFRSDSFSNAARNATAQTTRADISLPLTASRESNAPSSRHSDRLPYAGNRKYSHVPQTWNQDRPCVPSQQPAEVEYHYASQQHSDRKLLATQFNQLTMMSNGQYHDSQIPTISIPNLGNGSAIASTFSRSGVSRAGYGFTSARNATEDDSQQPSWRGGNSHISPFQSRHYHEHRSPTLEYRLRETESGAQSKYAETYSDNTPPSRTAYTQAEPRALAEWQHFSNGDVNPGTGTGMTPEQSAYLDARMRQAMTTSHLGAPYGLLYDPYASPHSFQYGGASPYLQIMPISLSSVDSSPGAQGFLPSDGVRSALMHEFRSNTKSRRYELKDVYDHVAEFSGDQYGSRFIQTRLETANSDEKDRIFTEIEPNAVPLMTDVFGNYVIQKYFEHGDQIHKKILANKMRGQVLNLSLQMYGCRVVQKALDHVLVDQQAWLISELEGHVLKCVKDQNGNHVIQKVIERCPPSTIGFIIAAFRGQIQSLSIHPYGCRVIQRCLEYCDPPAKAMILDELMGGIQGMISDQYGNYVVQHVVQHDAGEGRRLTLDIVSRSLEAYSKHKFASNVVEKCLEYADDSWRAKIVLALAHGEQRLCEGDGVLVGMIKDCFGNYVIRACPIQPPTIQDKSRKLTEQ